MKDDEKQEEAIQTTQKKEKSSKIPLIKVPRTSIKPVYVAERYADEATPTDAIVQPTEPIITSELIETDIEIIELNFNH